MRRWVTWPLAAAAMVGLTAGLAWIYRTPLVTRFVDRSLHARGVDARYRIDQIGFRTQRLSNVSIGDPHDPDLTAREVIVDVVLDWDGPRIQRLAARGVRLKGRWVGDRLTWGQLDRLLPADDGTPFELPDMAVSLNDVAATIGSPWGHGVVSVAGSGQLRDGFDGQIAVRVPRMMRQDCLATSIVGGLRLRINDQRPALTGPMGIAGLACGRSRFAVSDVRLGLNAQANRDFSSWRIESGLRSRRLMLHQLRGSATLGRLGLQRRRDGALLSEWVLTAQEARSPWVQARRLAIEGRGGRAANGAMTAEGIIRLAGGSAGADARRRLRNVASAGQAAVIGPLIAKAGDAVALAGRSFTLQSTYGLAQSGVGPMRISLGDVALDAASGASLRIDGERAVGWDRDGGISFAMAARFGGGGLPEGRIELSRAGDGAALTGRLLLRPYQAAGAMIAVAPTRFRAGANGTADFVTAIALSGPLGSGRVERLTVPVAGRIDHDGTLVISGKCRAVGWQAITTSGVALDRAAVRLCGMSGAPLLSLGPGGLQGSVLLPAFDLSGRAGSSPLHFAASGGRLSLGEGGFELRDLRVRIGDGDALTRLAAVRLSGTIAGDRLYGRLDQAEAQIGPVPLLLSDANGHWSLTNGRLAVNAALRITDSAPDDRFNPLRADAVELSMISGLISATAHLTEERGGASVANVRMRHDLGVGAGQADFSVGGLHFEPDGLQPRDLTPLALGVIANVKGTVEGEGEVVWDAQGVRSTGDFSSESLDFAAAFGPVQRLSGRIRFDDLIGLSTPPHQQVLIGSVNPGIEVTDGHLLYQLRPGRAIRVEGGYWPFAGGELRLQPTSLDFGADTPRHLTFDVTNVDAALFLQRFEFENISATGIFDGVLPTIFDEDGGRVQQGTLVSRGGGSLAYVGELSTRNLGTYANLAFGALKSIRYDSLAISMNGAIDGEMLTRVDFTGLSQGDGAVRNVLTRVVEQLPFSFSIRINAPFRQLLTSARGLYDPRTLIEQNLPALVQAEARAAAAREGSHADPAAPLPNPLPMPNNPGEVRPLIVQPRESEDRP